MPFSVLTSSVTNVVKVVTTRNLNKAKPSLFNKINISVFIKKNLEFDVFLNDITIIL